MMYNFGEKKQEKVKGKMLNVILTDKFNEARAKACELIDGKEYGLKVGDFWILKNQVKGQDFLLYSGLILSHNGCLKINDNLSPDKKFKPECLTLDKDGYGGSLVYTYICPEQGIAEVGEVSVANCKNDYPYAMALKRCMDRVILKNSKIAFAGILSEAESDEFKREFTVDEPKPDLPAKQSGDFTPTCADCGVEIAPVEHDFSVKRFKKPLCRTCQNNYR